MALCLTGTHPPAQPLGGSPQLTSLATAHLRHCVQVKCSQSVSLTRQGGDVPVAQLVKNPPAMRETWVRSLGWEDPLQKGKATQSMILAWIILWTV